MVSKYMYELQRAVRLVVDTGIHAFNWSYTKSFNYMKRYLNYSDELIKNEIIRYACIPSQALSYKVGEEINIFSLSGKGDPKLTDSSSSSSVSPK